MFGLNREIAFNFGSKQAMRNPASVIHLVNYCFPSQSVKSCRNLRHKGQDEIAKCESGQLQSVSDTDACTATLWFLL